MDLQNISRINAIKATHMFRYLRCASQTFAPYYKKKREKREREKEVKNQTYVSACNIFMCPPIGYTCIYCHLTYNIYLFLLQIFFTLVADCKHNADNMLNP